jgi:hypothetical protein
VVVAVTVQVVPGVLVLVLVPAAPASALPVLLLLWQLIPVRDYIRALLPQLPLPSTTTTVLLLPLVPLGVVSTATD